MWCTCCVRSSICRDHRENRAKSFGNRLFWSFSSDCKCVWPFSQAHFSDTQTADNYPFKIINAWRICWYPIEKSALIKFRRLCWIFLLMYIETFSTRQIATQNRQSFNVVRVCRHLTND